MASGDQPAFRVIDTDVVGANGEYRDRMYSYGGMTMRQWYAGMAITAAERSLSDVSAVYCARIIGMTEAEYIAANCPFHLAVAAQAKLIADAMLAHEQESK